MSSHNFSQALRYNSAAPVRAPDLIKSRFSRALLHLVHHSCSSCRRAIAIKQNREAGGHISFPDFPANSSPHGPRLGPHLCRNRNQHSARFRWSRGSDYASDFPSRAGHSGSQKRTEHSDRGMGRAVAGGRTISRRRTCPSFLVSAKQAGVDEPCSREFWKMVYSKRPCR